MAYPFNPLNPMNHSMYLESEIPNSIDEAIATIPTVPTYVNPNGPKLRPQPTKDSWYYNKDNLDDGHISTLEKLKAFAKGGTYNMIRGMFCDNNGFSWGRTLATAAGITAIALTGPIGVAIASGVGLIAAADNFAQSVRKAKTSVTDQQTREAYEGFGESTTTAGLALFGGFKGIQAIRRNFAFAKANPNAGITLKNKLMQWDVSKGIKINPESTGPSTADASAIEGGNGGNPTPPRQFEPNISVSEIDARGYVPDWKPTGEMPKPTTHPYFAESTPIGELPKPTTHPYFAESTPTGNIPQPVPKPSPKPVEFVSEWQPTGSPQKPTAPDFSYGTDSNHFFG